MQSIEASEADLATLLEGVQQGHVTIITRNGEPIAFLGTMEDYRMVEEVKDEYWTKRVGPILENLSANPAGITPLEDFVADVFGERAAEEFRSQGPVR